MTEQQAITDALAADGWSLAFTCKSEGARDKPSVWSCRLERAAQSLEIEYTKGAAHRRWKARLPFLGVDRRVFVELKGKRGQRVAQHFGRLTVLEAEVLEAGTEPEPPTVDEVLSSVVLDAGSVRHGQSFDEWCGDFGYDSDSRKAERAFNACRDEWSGLVRLGADFEKLEALFQDY